MYLIGSFILLTDFGERGKPYFMWVSEIGKWNETVISSGIKTQKEAEKYVLGDHINIKYENVMDDFGCVWKFAEDKNFAPKQDRSECPMTDITGQYLQMKMPNRRKFLK